MIPILRSSSDFFPLYSSTSLITEANWSTSRCAAATSSCFAVVFWFCRYQATPSASRPTRMPASIIHCPMPCPSSLVALFLRTAAGRLPSESRLILIIG